MANIAGSSSSGSPATSCLSQAETSQESEPGSRKSEANLGGVVKSAAMKKSGGNGGGGGSGASGVAAPKKQQQHQGSSSFAGVAQQQACLVASLQAEAVRQQQVVSTTFVEADTSSFRELVQKLTGMAEDAQDKMPITLPARHASRESSAHQRESSSVTWESHRDSIPIYSHHMGVMPGAGQDCGRGGGMGQRDAALMMLDERGFVRSSVSQEAYANWEKMIAGRNLPGGLNNVDAYRTISKVEPLAVRRSAFKMPVGKKLELKQGSSLRRDAVANAMFPNYWNSGGYPGVSPRSDVLRSPVTTLTRDPFDSHSFGPGTPGSYESSVTSLSPRFGHEGCSPRTPGSSYDHGFNIIDKRTRSLVQDVAQEFASCNMGQPAGNENRILAQPPQPEQQEYVLHPPLERRNGEPQLLSLFPLQSEKA